MLSRPDWHSRREACRLIGNIGKTAALGAWTEDRKVVDLFRSIDTDSDGELSVQELSRKLSSDSELQRLLALVQRTPESVIDHLNSATDALRPTIPLDEFLDIFKPASAAQRTQILASAADTVAQALTDPRPEVYDAAASALLGMGEAAAAKALTDRIALADDDESKIAAAEAMVDVLSARQGSVGPMDDPQQDSGALAAAHDLLQSPNWRVRAAGAGALGAAGILAVPFLAELDALSDKLGSLTVSGTPEGVLDGSFLPVLGEDGKEGPALRVQKWRRTSGEGGFLLYDAGYNPCPRWVLVQGFPALTGAAMESALNNVK